jgi:hypothetical protein
LPRNKFLETDANIYQTINNGDTYNNNAPWRGGRPPPVYATTSYIPYPTWDVPRWPGITIQGPILPIPRVSSQIIHLIQYNALIILLKPGCSQVPTTSHAITTTDATFTSTITEAPADGVLTVYYGDDNQLSTWGMSTFYEVYVYTTTQDVDIIGSGIACGISWGIKTVEAPQPGPASILAVATPTDAAPVPSQAAASPVVEAAPVPPVENSPAPPAENSPAPPAENVPASPVAVSPSPAIEASPAAPSVAAPSPVSEASPAPSASASPEPAPAQEAAPPAPALSARSFVA